MKLPHLYKRVPFLYKIVESSSAPESRVSVSRQQLELCEHARRVSEQKERGKQDGSGGFGRLDYAFVWFSY